MPVNGPSRDPRTHLPAAIAAAAASDDSDAALEAILGAGVAAFSPAAAAIFLSDPDRPGLALAASHGIEEGSPLIADAQDPDHPFSEAATGRAAVFDREATSASGESFVGAYLPLVVASGGVEAVLGSIGMVWPSPHPLSDEDREALSALASLAALAVDRARLASTASERSEWFERMAHTDPLTGLANERTVSRILELEMARAGRQGSELSLAMFDVDDFRATNEQGGHVAGDEVLRQVAAVLAESVRLVDTVGRIGGDEFVLVAPGSAGRDGRAPGARWHRGAPRGRGADRVGVGGCRPLPGGRHGFGGVDRGRNRRAGTGQGRGCRVGRGHAGAGRRNLARGDRRTE